MEVHPRLPARAMIAAVALAITAAVAAPAASQPRCAPTRPDALGPFYTPNAPERASTGRGLVLGGTVRSASGCAPLPGARIEWWSANPRGGYDDEHRATQIAGADGRFRYETDMPGEYPGRPRHVHVRVSTGGHRTLVTQVYPSAGQRSNDVEFVLIRE